MPPAAHTPISEQIAADLRERITERLPLPDRLTLPGLAAHYRVSTTPVRQAVEVLVAEGRLLRQPTGRIEIAPLPVPAPARTGREAIAEAPSGSEWEAALAAQIVARSLSGDTSYLREEKMAIRFGVGRTVLRQAFSRLAGKGLLQHIPRCGWRVRVFDSDDMRAYLTARETVELAALDLAFPHLEADVLNGMLRANEPEGEGTSTLPRLNNDLHRYLLQRSGNHYLQEFLDRHGMYYTFLFDFAAPEAHVMAEMAAQHREILNALRDGDLPAARAALSRHIRAQEPIVARLMASLAGTPADCSA